MERSSFEGGVHSGIQLKGDKGTKGDKLEWGGEERQRGGVTNSKGLLKKLDGTLLL